MQKLVKTAVGAVAALALVPSVQAAPAAAPPLHCALQKDGEAFAGGCGKIGDETPVFTLSPGGSITTGIWRSDLHPSAVWTGTMTDSDGKFATALEIYGGGHGMLRTEYGWFAVSHANTASTLTFDLDAAHEVTPNALDR